ncbi:hypothetical protein OUZ56_028505 [Daphnia magna]|uniref:Uncharacterized protein n=1 Tax=Daphnia magna TaxID=35525 RepID=A0ABR0B476_9CRUS|nr:hypothetical protein OUZ56_028505 [Daphnia magna]
MGVNKSHHDDGQKAKVLTCFGCRYVRVVGIYGVKGRRKRVIVVSSPSCDVHVPSIDSDPR